MSAWLAPAGSPAVPRIAAGWVRGTALPALGVALADVGAARDRAGLGFVGASGGAYALHTASLLHHLGALRDRLLAAAVLFESYADRLVLHEATLASLRARAVAAGLEVVGDTVLPPTGLVDSVAWSEIASAVLGEHQSLAAWVATELDAAVPTYSDPDLTRWVAGFLDDNRVSLAAGGLETTARQGGVSLAARELLAEAARMDRLAKIPGPVSTAYETVVALESDTPAEGVAGVVGGVAATAAVTATAAALVPAAPVVLVGGAAVLVGIGGTWLATKVWQQLPDGFQDAADEAVGDTWECTKSLAEDAWDSAGDMVDDFGDSLVGWAR